MGHYYGKDGTPEHFRGPNGSATTLREARKLGLLPSVTEVLQVISKPQLTAWLVKQGILAALTLPKIECEAEEAYIARIDADGRKQAQAAADEGQLVHDAIECHFLGKAFSRRFRPHVDGVLAKLAKLFPKVTDWEAEKSFGHPLGFGGKCDLHSPSTGIVVDWKGKDGDFTDGKKLAWDQHWQLSAYQVGLRLPTFNGGANIFFSRTHPGETAAHIWEAPDLEAGWRVFRAALDLHKALKKYDGGW